MDGVVGAIVTVKVGVNVAVLVGVSDGVSVNVLVAVYVGVLVMVMGKSVGGGEGGVVSVTESTARVGSGVGSLSPCCKIYHPSRQRRATRISPPSPPAISVNVLGPGFLGDSKSY